MRDPQKFQLSPPSTKDADAALREFKPETKARRYTLKPHEEKASSTYKLKRARNNDAVRKSRSKAKEAQMARDEENNKLKHDNTKLQNEIKKLIEANAVSQ